MCQIYYCKYWAGSPYQAGRWERKRYPKSTILVRPSSDMENTTKPTQSSSAMAAATDRRGREQEHKNTPELRTDSPVVQDGTRQSFIEGSPPGTSLQSAKAVRKALEAVRFALEAVRFLPRIPGRLLKPSGSFLKPSGRFVEQPLNSETRDIVDVRCSTPVQQASGSFPEAPVNFL